MSDTPICTHLDTIEVVAPPDEIEGCEDCLRIGSRWLHLRMCMSCGGIRCCDSSPHRHASKHARASRHPVMRSAQPGEEWSWCFVDEIGLVIEGIEGQTQVPPSPLGG